MTHQSQTNGASLEDCHTNFFALTDLCGIKWRKLVQAERPDASPDPLDDPVLRSYSKCLAVDILCVWQRVAAPKPDPDPSVYLELSLQQPSTVTHPPLSLTAAKELWIFWYGEEPDLTDLVAPELLKSSDGGGQGSWESGLSYECRSLLFKALHNLIERCLLSRDVIRLGKWFVQPASNDRVLGRSSMHLSYSFAFFVHGDSTVCASMDIREHPPIRPLSAADLAEAQATAQQTEAVQKGVVLAPYGLAATLTGQSFRNVDPQTQKTLDDWSAFYPLYSKDTNQLPPVVEVVSGGVKMRYPTKYVLVTDLDDTKSIINSSSSVSSNNCTSSSSSSVAPIKMQQNNGATPATSSSSSLATTNTTNSSSNKENTPLVLSNNQHSSSNSSQNISKMGSGAKATQLPVVGPETAASNDLGNQLSMHIPLKIGTMMPERVWQDCIMHGTASMKGQGASSETENGPAETSCWDFSDPTRKYQCQCVRCKNSSSSRKSTSCIGGKSGSSSRTSGGTSSSSISSCDSKPVRLARIPFHKRPNTTCSSANSGISSGCIVTNSGGPSSVSVASSSSSSGNAASTNNNNNQTNLRPLCHNNTNSGNMSDSSIANEGPPSAYRTPRSDSIPIPSVGSPPSAAPSPILDSQTSVPPQDQFLHGMSPHPQGGIHTPLTPSLENADKNTPAPTPTDQHESKGIPESPYQPTIVNSVEPPQTLLSNSMPNATATVTPKLEPPSETKPVIGGVAGPSNAPSESVLTSIVSLLKRPSLSSRDYENILDDDYNPKQILYDYSLWDAWLNHPVKRFKASDDKVGLGISKGINLYANEKLPECPELPDQVLALPTKLMADVKQELPSGILEPEAIKSEIMDDDKSENLFTEQGLRPSYNDLEHILENSDDASNDEGLQVHTPPASNKSPSQFDDCKRTIGFSSGPNIGSIGSIELSKMFPTPPSIEHHPSCSPYGSGIPDSVMTEIVEKAEVYPNLGSPVPEPIDDWSYVYQSPTICKLVGSSKYAPLQNLPSQQQTFSPSLMYKPSWLQQQSSQVPVPALSSATPSQQQIASQQKIKKEPGRALTPKNVPPSPRRPPSLPGGPFGVSRPRMSPAMSPMFNHGAASPMFGNSVRTPLAPPPPYDQAVASPASSSSFLRSNDPTNTEASALLVNVLLQDTALNVHRDHNFNSCMICVCNADSKKSIGNIRGSDSGTYLPLPNSSFRHMGSLDGYVDDDPISCSCGFSAIVNRRLAHRAGLFYEDEMEITSMAEDPALAKKTPLLSLLAPRQTDKPSEAHAVMDLLRDQCSVVPNCASSVLRAALTWRQSLTPQRASSLAFNVLEHSDAQEIISLALEQAQLLQEFRRPRSQPQVSHKWPFCRASGPRTNLDIIRIMKSMTPLLQDAFHKKSNTRLWDAPYTVQGPLTWRQFHKLAGRSLGQCQPQPIPSIVVGHEKDWLSISPYAIQHWDKLLLEPYSYPRDIAYVVLVPDNDYVVSRTRSYFKELSTTYEMCRLGRHAPIKGWDGLIRVGTKLSAARAVSEADEWVSSGAPGDAKFTENLRHYAQACQHHLAPYLAKVPGDRSLLDPPDHKTHVDRPMPSPMPPPSSLEGGQEKAPSTPKAADEEHEKHEKPAQPEPIRVEDENSPIPHVVVYIVEPFSCGSDSPDTARMACLNLLRCFLNLLNAVPESMRANISTQIISLESVLELGQARQRLRYSDHMRYLALSIFSQSRRSLVHTNTVKSLTGFGTAASVEAFLKGKEEKDRFPYKLYTPPYILSSQHEKRESAESFGQTSIEQQSSVLYCNYCLSEDQSWLLAVATDNRGELLETATINVDIPNRTRRRKASARRAGLQKLMDFIVGVISQSVHPWHLVIGRVGRIGHGELKGWSWLLSKPQLVKVSKHLKDLCKQCSLMSGGSVPSILSACLVTLEPDTQLRVMPDQFTPDERFSQISTQLLTPQDVTCTHILVFPVSAVAQSFATAFKEQQEPDLGEDEFFAGLDDPNDEDVDGIGGLGDIFGDCFGEDNPELPQSSPGGQDRQSPTDMQGNPNRMSVGPDGTSCGQGRGGSNNAQEQENVGPVLQQPLALGYLVSTAPTGRMPPWFWAACPHLENVCPVFLRTALHLHCSNIQTSVDEDSLNPQAAASGHPLDSQFTADVLRYILEGYNVLSWLALDSNTHDRLSCLPIHVQVLMQLYHMSAAMA